jgi:hypothetical protein
VKSPSISIHNPKAKIQNRAAACLSLCAALSLAGCGGAPKVRTTFLNSVDLVEMTDRMAESFAADQVMRERTPQSRQWIVSIDRMHNLTNQVIPEREKWLYIARLRAVLQQSEIARQRNIIWVIPPERWPLVQEELGDAPHELRRTPTHEMTAEFGALTNTSGKGRSDAYVCEYQLVDIVDGRIIWSDIWEVKRSVSGKTYD